MIRELVCVSCPLGCALKAEINDKGEVTAVTGNTCKRGEKYAIDECTNPVRMVTSTLKVEGACLPVVPVKTSKPVPKGKMFDIMKAIDSCEVKAPIKIGDVLISNVCDTGADIVATNELK